MIDMTSSFAASFLLGILSGVTWNIAWLAFRRYRDLKSKDMFVKHFALAADLILEDEGFKPECKTFLLEIASKIQNRKLAKLAVEGRLDSGSERALAAEQQVKLMLEMPQEQRVKFLGTLMLFLMALSFSHRHGGKLRRRLMGEVADQKTLIQEIVRVIRMSLATKVLITA